MSEPIRKPVHAPESYDPKDVPEIMRLAERARGQTDRPEAPRAAAASGGAGRVIAGLSKVDWSDATRQNEFVWSVISALGALGEKLDYDYVCAVSGGPFRTYYTKGGYNHGNYTAANALWTVERTFRMLGYRATVHARSDFETDRALIMRSIDRGVPALTLNGIVDTSDCCVIAGYDNDGGVLLGYSAFMCCCDDFTLDPTGYFRKPDWHSQETFRACGVIVTIDEKTPQPPKEEVYRETLRMAVRLLEGADSAQAAMGLYAHDAYAQAITGANRRGETGGAYFNMLCNNKMYLDKKFAAPFFAGMGNEALADIYRQINRLVAAYGKIIPHNFKHEKRLKKPKMVARFCEKLFAIRDLERRALALMQAELLRLAAA